VIGFFILLPLVMTSGGLAAMRTQRPLAHIARNVIHYSGQAAWLYALTLIPLAVLILHPKVFGRISSKALRAFGRDPLPVVMSLRDVLALIVFYSLIWLAVAFGIYSVARSVTYIPYNDILLVGSAQAIGYWAALVTLIAPAGLGVRDAAFAWAVKAALPGRSFALGSLIAIAVRGVMTVGELIYVAAVTALGRREGWSIPTGIIHASPEEEARVEEVSQRYTGA